MYGQLKKRLFETHHKEGVHLNAYTHRSIGNIAWNAAWTIGNWNA